MPYHAIPYHTICPLISDYDEFVWVKDYRLESQIQDHLPNYKSASCVSIIEWIARYEKKIANSFLYQEEALNYEVPPHNIFS
jgi:hypothetical protein